MRSFFPCLLLVLVVVSSVAVHADPVGSFNDKFCVSDGPNEATIKGTNLYRIIKGRKGQGDSLAEIEMPSGKERPFLSDKQLGTDSDFSHILRLLASPSGKYLFVVITDGDLTEAVFSNKTGKETHRIEGGYGGCWLKDDLLVINSQPDPDNSSVSLFQVTDKKLIPYGELDQMSVVGVSENQSTLKVEKGNDYFIFDLATKQLTPWP